MADEAAGENEGAYIRLEDFLKFRGMVNSGGQAKVKIQAGEVSVNGTVETRRARKLRAGDKVQLAGEKEIAVEIDDDSPGRRVKKSAG